MASSEIAISNFDLSGRTEQQAVSLERTDISIEQLSSTVRQNAENAKRANTFATMALEIAEKSGKALRAGGVDHVRDNSSAKSVAEVTNVIEGIAFQTNILALNAAVKASRAGDHGRGFAVVASEVRNLAQRSATAAKEIAKLIATAVHRVANGSVLAVEAGKTKDEVVMAVKRVTDIMGEISTASVEQKAGSKK